MKKNNFRGGLSEIPAKNEAPVCRVCSDLSGNYDPSVIQEEGLKQSPRCLRHICHPDLRHQLENTRRRPQGFASHLGPPPPCHQRYSKTLRRSKTPVYKVLATLTRILERHLRACIISPQTPTFQAMQPKCLQR